MKPPMNQKVIANVPILDVNGKPMADKYGRPKTDKKESIARVQFKSQVVVDNRGTAYEVALEIDLPPSFIPKYGMSIEYVTIDGEQASGTIRAVEEIVNLAGNRVHYRTVFVE